MVDYEINALAECTNALNKLGIFYRNQYSI